MTQEKGKKKKGKRLEQKKTSVKSPERDRPLEGRVSRPSTGEGGNLKRRNLGKTQDRKELELLWAARKKGVPGKRRKTKSEKDLVRISCNKGENKTNVTGHCVQSEIPPERKTKKPKEKGGNIT